MRKRCRRVGCRVLIGSGSYCSAHKPYGNGWGYLRARILERDNYLCLINGPLCRGRASTVDHIDGDPLNNDPSNLRAACRPCNSQKGGIA